VEPVIAGFPGSSDLKPPQSSALASLLRIAISPEMVMGAAATTGIGAFATEANVPGRCAHAGCHDPLQIRTASINKQEWNSNRASVLRSFITQPSSREMAYTRRRLPTRALSPPISEHSQMVSGCDNVNLCSFAH
jgi:hypothetical protein